MREGFATHTRSSESALEEERCVEEKQAGKNKRWERKNESWCLLALHLKV